VLHKKIVFIILPNGATGGSVQEKLTFPLETLRKTLKYFNVHNSIVSSWDSKKMHGTRNRNYSR